MFVESQALLHAEDTAHGIVDTAHGHLAFLHQLFQQYTGVNVVGLHNHVDTRIDGYPQRVLLVAGHLFSRIQIIDVRPVGNQHTVPSRLLLRPSGQQLMVCMDGHTIHRCRVHHDRHRSLADGCQEGSEELLPQQRRCDIGWCAVLSRPGSAIAQIVLQRYGHVLLVYMLRVVTLETDGLHASHLCVHVAVLTEVLVDAGPAGVTSQVYRRTERPGHADGTCLVGRSLGALSGYLAVEGSAHVDVLWEQRTPLRVCRAVILV